DASFANLDQSRTGALDAVVVPARRDVWIIDIGDVDQPGFGIPRTRDPREFGACNQHPAPVHDIGAPGSADGKAAEKARQLVEANVDADHIGVFARPMHGRRYPGHVFGEERIDGRPEYVGGGARAGKPRAAWRIERVGRIVPAGDNVPTPVPGYP